MTIEDQVRASAGAYCDAPALLGDPIPVEDAAGRLASWFVPLIEGGWLLGFVELLPDLSHRRTSSFRRRPGSYAGCPRAASWIDPAAVLSTAARAIRRGEAAGRPVLSFDGAPDRLAWAIPLRGPEGARTIFVAGDAVWPSSNQPGKAGNPGDYR